MIHAQKHVRTNIIFKKYVKRHQKFYHAMLVNGKPTKIFFFGATHPNMRPEEIYQRLGGSHWTKQKLNV